MGNDQGRETSKDSDSEEDYQNMPEFDSGSMEEYVDWQGGEEREWESVEKVNNSLPKEAEQKENEKINIASLLLKNTKEFLDSKVKLSTQLYYLSKSKNPSYIYDACSENKKCDDDFYKWAAYVSMGADIIEFSREKVSARERFLQLLTERGFVTLDSVKYISEEQMVRGAVANDDEDTIEGIIDRYKKLTPLLAREFGLAEKWAELRLLLGRLHGDRTRNGEQLPKIIIKRAAVWDIYKGAAEGSLISSNWEYFEQIVEKYQENSSDSQSFLDKLEPKDIETFLSAAVASLNPILCERLLEFFLAEKEKITREADLQAAAYKGLLGALTMGRIAVKKATFHTKDVMSYVGFALMVYGAWQGRGQRLGADEIFGLMKNYGSNTYNLYGVDREIDADAVIRMVDYLKKKMSKVWPGKKFRIENCQNFFLPTGLHIENWRNLSLICDFSNYDMDSLMVEALRLSLEKAKEVMEMAGGNINWENVWAKIGKFYQGIRIEERNYILLKNKEAVIHNFLKLAGEYDRRVLKNALEEMMGDLDSGNQRYWLNPRILAEWLVEWMGEMEIRKKREDSSNLGRERAYVENFLANPGVIRSFDEDFNPKYLVLIALEKKLFTVMETLADILGISKK